MALAASPFAFSAAIAQEEADAEEEVTLEEIVVTGSRIPRAGFDTLQPAVTIDLDFIDTRGFTNVAQALNEIPAFGIPGSSNQGGQGSQNIGQNFVNAFGLGSQRTLTLINGRRTVGQNTPTAVGTVASSGLQVDLNIIPTALIERIETIFVGGAPIYGSDAIAATVNIILKDDFEGLDLDAQFGIAQRGDAENFRIRGLFGGNFASGRGNATVSAEFVTVTALGGVDRQRALDGYGFCENPADTGANDGVPDELFCKDQVTVWQVPNTGLIVTPPGFIAVNSGPFDTQPIFTIFEGGLDIDGNPIGNTLIYDQSGRLVPISTQNIGDIDTIFFSRNANCGDTTDLVTCLPETNTLISPLDRWIITGNSHYQLTDNTRMFIETLFARTESRDTNNQPPWSVVAFGPGQQGVLQINMTDNPFVPQQTLDLMELNGFYDPTVVDDPATRDDDQFLFMNKSNIDIVQGRENTRLQNVVRIAAGLEGEFDVFGNRWNWDAYYIFGISDSLSTQTDLNGPRYGMALDAVVDADGNIVCRVVRDPVPTPESNSQFPPLNPTDQEECLPFNPFGFENNDQDVLDYLVQKNFRSSLIRQQVIEANVAGDVLDLPAGPLAMAAGVTHRREFGRFDVAQGTEIGIDSGTPIQNVRGGFNTYEIYGEMLVPLIDGGEGLGFPMPIIENLTLEGAARFVDNTFAGKDVTWTAGGRMTFNLPLVGTGFQLRGNFTQSIRSPSIPELFLPTSQVFTFAQDPCDPRFTDGGPNPATRRANCEAQFAQMLPGFDPNIFGGDVTNLDDFVAIITNASQPGTTGGNRELLNEVADSWTIGGVIQPEFIPGLTLSIDWVSITLNDAIVQITGTQLLNACFDNSNFPNAPACSKFNRNPDNFQIRDPELDFLNAAVRDFRGLVSNISYTSELADLPLVSSLPGSINLSGNFFYTKRHQQTVGGEDLDTFAGEANFEKFRMQLNLVYTLDRFSWMFQVLHTAGGSFSNEATAEARDINEFPYDRVFNTTFMYQLTDSIRARVVINNIFDRIDPPLLAASLTGNNNEFNDIVGRRIVLGISGNF